MVDEIKEVASAVKETAKAVGHTVGAVEKLSIFFAKVMGEPIDITCAMLSESLKIKRWKRQLRLVDKCEEIIQKRKLSGKHIPLPPKFAIPIFHYASLEEDDYLHDLWVNLLISAIDPNYSSVRSSYIEIIKQLEYIDAKILDESYSYYWSEIERQEEIYREKIERENADVVVTPADYPIPGAGIKKKLGISIAEYEIALDNLFRLRCAEPYVEEIDIKFDDMHRIPYTRVHGSEQFCLTSLGLDFVEACMSGQSKYRARLESQQTKRFKYIQK